MVLILSIPPSQNHAYVNYKNGRRGPSALLRRWNKDAKLLIQSMVKEPAAEPQGLFVTFYWPDNRERDVDNVLQPLFNALKGTLIRNDCWQVIPLLQVYSTLDRDDPRVELFIKDLDDCPGAEKLSRTSLPTEGRGKPFTGEDDGDTHKDNQRAA